MSKINMPISNDYCPQTLFLYGTYQENGDPNFGLFCWFSYCFDSELGVMACIGGEKLTKDRILKNCVFSANLVTEKLLPLADYLGNHSGYDADKMKIPVAVEKGRVLDVPTLADSPVTFELEVSKTVDLDDGLVLLCKIKNVMAEESLAGQGKSLEEKLNGILPVCTTCSTYFSWKGAALGGWGTIQTPTA